MDTRPHLCLVCDVLNQYLTPCRLSLCCKEHIAFTTSNISLGIHLNVTQGSKTVMANTGNHVDPSPAGPELIATALVKSLIEVIDHNASILNFSTTFCAPVIDVARDLYNDINDFVRKASAPGIETQTTSGVEWKQDYFKYTEAVYELEE